jgi:protein involved in polysaccharide export with SLBB domain
LKVLGDIKVKAVIPVLRRVANSIILGGLVGTAAAGSVDTNAAPGQPLKTRLLVPNDLIELKVYRQPDLDTKARVGEDGTVTLPLLGSVKIGGMSTEQARALVRDLLAKDYLVNPQVTLSVVEYARSVFTVMGEVQRPGSYDLPPEQGLNVLQAIAMAGGYTRLGAPGKVRIQRMEQGQRRTYPVDTNATNLGEKGAMFEILPGDMITVGEKVF